MLRCAAADWAGREDACRREMRCRRHPPSRRRRALAQTHTQAAHESPPVGVVVVVVVVRRPLLASTAGLIQIRIQIQIHPSSRRPVAAHASRQSVLLAHTFRVNQPTSLCFRRSLAPLGATARGGLSPFFRPPSPVPASVPGLDRIGPLVRPWRPAQHPRSSAAPESHAFAVPLHLIKSTESNRSSTHREPRGPAFLVPYRAVPYEPQSIGNREPASDQCGLFVYLRPRRPA